jgi:hypothetical protein
MNRLMLLAFSLLPALAFSQKKLELGAFGGFANYQGDMAENRIELSETKISYGGFLRYHLNDKVKIRGNFAQGYLSGNDSNAEGGKKNRGWSMECTVTEGTLIGEFHPLGRERVSSTGIFERGVSPYLGLGLGVAHFAPTVSVTNPLDANLFPEAGEKNLSASVPVVLGARADLFEFFSLSFEIGWRATFNDYLDGVSKNGNNKRNDWYVLAGFTASVFLGRQDTDYNLGN